LHEYVGENTDNNIATATLFQQSKFQECNSRFIKNSFSTIVSFDQSNQFLQY